MSDITKLKKMLEDRAQAVAEMLLPNGRLMSGEWCVGSVAGEKGQSMKICVKGAKVGVWQDFESGLGGDLIDLWCAVKGDVVSDSLKDIKAYLGVSEAFFHQKPQKKYIKPKKPKCQEPKNAVYSYLCEERGIPGKALQVYKIGEQDRHAIFPFMKDGELILAKRYPIDADEKGKRRPVPTERDCEPILFGWQAIPDDAREVTITEGELDALSMWAFGFPALSVPFGGGSGAKQQWIERDFESLERFDKIYVATDMDEPGEEAAREIMKRLGLHRCVRVKLPKKDANECLTSGIEREEIEQCMTKAKYFTPEGLKMPSDYADSVISLFYPDANQKGCSLPFDCLKDKINFRPGEVTIWTGPSGHGKTQITSQAAVHWISEGERICVASLEMDPAQTLRRMVKQAANMALPSADEIRNTLDWMDNGLVLLDKVGKADVNKILEIFEYAYARFGCNQFVIDSLMRLGVAGDDYTGQEAVMFHIVNWAIEKDIHVHLVAHAKKGGKDDRASPPETEDIKGAMEIGANAFNIITIWRNKKREDELSKAKFTNDHGKVNDLQEEPGVILNCAKQRNGDFEGKSGLWFNQDSYQYRGRDDPYNGFNYLGAA